MKKTYISPILEVEKQQTIGMLATSLPLGGDDPVDIVTEEDEILVREFDFEEEFSF